MKNPLKDGEVLLKTRANTTLRGTPHETYAAVYVTAKVSEAQIPPQLTDDELEANKRAHRHPTTREQEVRSREDAALMGYAGTLRIVDAPGGDWYLTTLLKHPWSETDTLDLDAGQRWTITNPKELLNEIRSLVGEDKFLEFVRLTERVYQLELDDWGQIFGPTKH